MSPRLNQRGSALLVSIIVVLVIAAVGVGVIRFASRDLAGATGGRKEAQVAACAEAARTLLTSQWKLLGAHGVKSPPLDVLVEAATQTRLRGGHYGQNPTASTYWNSSSKTWVVNGTMVNNIQVIELNPLTVGPAFVANDLTNRVGDAAQPYRIVVHCSQGDGREVEVEFGLQYGL
jgi:hypothetical protein